MNQIQRIDAWVILPLLAAMTDKNLRQSVVPGPKFINPPTVSKPKGYSQAAQIDLGTAKMLMISGQVAVDQKGNLQGIGDYAKQADQIFLNIKHIVESAGGNMANVVKLNFYLVDISQVQQVRDIRDKYVNLKNPPASTLVEVSKLFRDDILVEIDATAIIPSKN